MPTDKFKNIEEKFILLDDNFHEDIVSLHGVACQSRMI